MCKINICVHSLAYIWNTPHRIQWDSKSGPCLWSGYQLTGLPSELPYLDLEKDILKTNLKHICSVGLNEHVFGQLWNDSIENLEHKSADSLFALDYFSVFDL